MINTAAAAAAVRLHNWLVDYKKENTTCMWLELTTLRHTNRCHACLTNKQQFSSVTRYPNERQRQFYIKSNGQSGSQLDTITLGYFFKKKTHESMPSLSPFRHLLAPFLICKSTRRVRFFLFTLHMCANDR